ncbi:chromate transporter [Kurthia huakuii]|uniref:chromate transporter n=1 Tax=Kurthia huakuii TaxID=1421019 RepID=UPI00049638FB|nr:chromate transporter [Kurthia huakuii]MBM7699479.1 chromate transporter [Kurthia huakuii]
MIQLFIGFFIANILGYGGGPSTIPLMYEEIVERYKWLTNEEFSNVLALGNALPGPIATKIAAFVGYDTYGLAGVLIALTATIVPTVVLLIMLMNLLQRHRASPIIKGMTLLIQPILAMMMFVIIIQMSRDSLQTIGTLQFLLIGIVAYWALMMRKFHPAYVILGAFLYGGIVLPFFMN